MNYIKLLIFYECFHINGLNLNLLIYVYLKYNRNKTLTLCYNRIHL